MIRKASILATLQLFVASMAAAHPGHTVLVSESGLAHQVFEPLHGLGLLVAALAVALGVARLRRSARVRR